MIPFGELDSAAVWLDFLFFSLLFRFLSNQTERFRLLLREHIELKLCLDADKKNRKEK
jgi:hypothetical protein